MIYYFTGNLYGLSKKINNNFYFPIQKSLKIESNRSSLVISLCVIEEKRILDLIDINKHFNKNQSHSPVIISNESQNNQFSEREILYKILFDLKNDLNDLKKITLDLIQEGKGTNETFHINNAELIQRVYNKNESLEVEKLEDHKSETVESEIMEENLSLQDNECEIIQKALDKNKGKRKLAAKELGISERTLYRKIKQYDL